jgi:hypothetical protein
MNIIQLPLSANLQVRGCLTLPAQEGTWRLKVLVVSLTLLMGVALSGLSNYLTLAYRWISVCGQASLLVILPCVLKERLIIQKTSAVYYLKI